MTTTDFFLSSENTLANTDQIALEDKALSLLGHPTMVRARAVADYLYREVMQYPQAAQMDGFDNMVEEYAFHYALRAVASDGNYPAVLRFMAPPHHWFGRDLPGSRWGGDSPDFIYRLIAIAHGGEYEIRGRVTGDRPPTTHYVLLSDATAAPENLQLLDGLDIVPDTNGEFVITVDASPAGSRPNHIQTKPGSMQIWVRDALEDWLAQSPNELRVTRLNPPERDPLNDDELAQRAARCFVDGVYYSYYVGRITTSLPHNKVIPPSSSGPLGGMATQFTGRCNVVLEPDEAMILTASAAGALFRNAVLTDVFMISLDYWDRSGSLNSAQMVPDENGLFTYVIAHEDPGICNWLDTGGTRQMIFGHRWQSFPSGQAAEVPTLSGRVVKFRELANALPAGVRRCAAADRQTLLAARKAGYAKRFIDC